MEKKMIDQSCADFTAALASKQPVPGGGGAAALTAALGTALCSMVGNFTIGKKKYAGVQDDIAFLLRQCGDLQQRMLALVDADAQALDVYKRQGSQLYPCGGAFICFAAGAKQDDEKAGG